MGAGHSGSTILDIVLGNHPEVVAVGELYKLPRSGWVRSDDRRCACGQPIHRCPFWTEVHDRWIDRVGLDGVGAYIGLQDRFERSRSVWPRLLSERFHPSSDFTLYGSMTDALYRTVLDVSGKRVVVDSSKPPVRNYALLLNDRLDVRVVHLIRDGRGVAWSRSKSRARDVEGGAPRDRVGTSPRRSSVDWLVANLESEWVARTRGAGRITSLRYESFVEDPQDALRTVAALVGEDLAPLGRALAEGRPMDVGHNVGGNRLRMSKNIVLRADYAWTSMLPEADRRTFWRIAGWLARRYGYSR